jgi:hypothetical protein
MRANCRLAASLSVAVSLLATCPGASALGAAARDAEGATGAGGVGPLAADLLAAACRLTGLPPPGRPPPVLLMPAVALAGAVCAGACRGAGAYLPGQGVLLPAELDPVGDARGRALLLHELVLYVLDRAQADPGLEPCLRYQRWERRAYAAQHAYVEAAGLPGLTLAGPQRWITGCGSPPAVDWPAVHLAGVAGPVEAASR